MRFNSGAGVMADPDAFLLSVGADYFLRKDLALGPLVQFGLSDDTTVIAPSANLKKLFDLKRDDALQRLTPYAQGGLGLAYLDEDDRRGDDDDLGLLLNAGFGADYDVNDGTQVGTGVMFNFLPGEVLDERFFFSWQVISIGFRF